MLKYTGILRLRFCCLFFLFLHVNRPHCCTLTCSVVTWDMKNCLCVSLLWHRLEDSQAHCSHRLGLLWDVLQGLAALGRTAVFGCVGHRHLLLAVLDTDTYCWLCWTQTPTAGCVGHRHLLLAVLDTDTYCWLCWTQTPTAGCVGHRHLLLAVLDTDIYCWLCWTQTSTAGCVGHRHLLLAVLDTDTYCWLFVTQTPTAGCL